MFEQITEEMLGFVGASVTPFHAVNSICDTLTSNGYVRLEEGQEWNIECDGKYYVTRNGSSVIAFHTGNSAKDYSYNIVATHLDSPTFKLKENAAVYCGEKYSRLNVEGYGGMICSTWLDRPLSVAGRVIVKDTNNRLCTKLVNLDRDLLLIPNAAVHMNREINDGFSYNKQVDLLPLLSGDKCTGGINKLIADELSCDVTDIVGSDLFLYARVAPSVWGANSEFVSSSRLDDLQCTFAALKALTDTNASSAINVMACFDNEEVGSTTKQGADSTFLQDTLMRINQSLGGTNETYLRALSDSFMLSADNAHAVHPAHPEYTDESNRVYMNEGVVIKSHAGQKYTSDAMSMAIVRQLASYADVPIQFFANRSDKVGGSTLGNISAGHVSVKCADIGAPQLAMHSSYETCGMKDTYYLWKLMKSLYMTRLSYGEGGCIDFLT